MVWRFVKLECLVPQDRVIQGSCLSLFLLGSCCFETMQGKIKEDKKPKSKSTSASSHTNYSAKITTVSPP